VDSNSKELKGNNGCIGRLYETKLTSKIKNNKAKSNEKEKTEESQFSPIDKLC
jgi:hypothetical protein